MKTSKKDQKLFIKGMEQVIVHFGGVRAKHPFSDSIESFEINTTVGVLNIHVDRDLDTIFSVFARFMDKEKYSTCDIISNRVNIYSGKWNFHSREPHKIRHQLYTELKEITLKKELI
jgi:hypothetical protein